MSPVAPRPLSVVLVATNRQAQRFAEDASFIYRCDNLGRALRSAGHAVHLCHLSQAGAAPAADVVVLHRPRLTWRLRWHLARWRRAGVRVLADLDDLVFDADLAESSPAWLNRQLPLRTIRARFAECGAALRAVDAVCVSTLPLLEECRRWLAPAGVAGSAAIRPELLLWPNAVHESWRALPPASPPDAAAPRLLRYLPGTRSHDRDFALLAGPLSDWLRRHPDCRLEVVGPLDFDLDLPAAQVVHRPKTPFPQYHALFADTWLNLAPLEATRFNHCKSALKMIEAGHWGVPTLGSPLPDAERLLGDAALVADAAADWLGWLDRLHAEPGLRDDLGRRAQARVRAEADLASRLPAWLALARRRSPA